MAEARDYISSSVDLFLGGRCVGCGRSGAPLCTDCAAQLVSLPTVVRPSPCPAALPPVCAVAGYDGVAKAALVAHKEHARLALARPLGRALALSVLGVLTRNPRREVSSVVLVPPATASATARARGHDPLTRIAKECTRTLRASGIDAEFAPALRLVRRIADQSRLTAGARASNLGDAFEVTPAHQRRLRGQPVVVVDDIITTGATTMEASRALRAVEADVVGAAVVAATSRRCM